MELFQPSHFSDAKLLGSLESQVAIHYFTAAAAG